MKRLKFYIYSCETHRRGEFVRQVGPDERNALDELEKAVVHATNCWAQGCQNKLTEVRLVEVID